MYQYPNFPSQLVQPEMSLDIVKYPPREGKQNLHAVEGYDSKPIKSELLWVEFNW
jgi:hypothetical protein